MVCQLILPDVRLFGNGVVCQLAALLVLVMPLVLLLRLMPQPEVIRDHQPDGSHGNTTYHQPGPTLLLAPLCGVLRGAFGTAGGLFG